MPKWRSGSEFGTGRRVPLDREQRAVFRAKLTMQRKPGRLSSSAVRLAQIMLDKLGADGRLDPSIATLAELARVDESTVVRCLGRLKACGFLEWTRRLVRCAAGGWRVEQASNAYVLTVPASDTHFGGVSPNRRKFRQAFPGVGIVASAKESDCGTLDFPYLG